MKKTWIILLTGMLVIGLIPGAMANPKIDSNAQAKNDKQITVDVDGANAADAAINQILKNNGNQDNHNAGVGGNAQAISENVGNEDQNVGNNDNLGGCNGASGSSTSSTNNPTNGNGGFLGPGIAASAGVSIPVLSGNGGSGFGCNSNPSANANLNQNSNANAFGGEGYKGDVTQSNTVRQDALAAIDVHQSLTQPVDIRESQTADAQEDSQIDFSIPVNTFDNMDSMIEIPIENGNNASEPGDKTN